MSPPTPRVFIIRHGETEWSLNGRHTGVTDIPLTANGERRIRATGRALVGKDRLIVPTQMSAILVSPRARARRTLELLVDEGLAHHADPESQRKHGQGPGKVDQWIADGKVVVREDVREWDYGRYEGALTAAIQEERKNDGKGRWLIWKDGCPGGESPADVTARLDALIAEIRQKYHKPALDHARAGGDAASCPAGDVLVVAHGHILRAFAARWIGRALTDNPNFLLEAGGVGTLSYEHHNIEEPAIMLGGAFMVEGEDER